MYAAYNSNNSAYLVVENLRTKILVGGAGVSSLIGASPKICELKKMYLLSNVRGHGLGLNLLNQTIKVAKRLGYQKCYLETLMSMTNANRLYKKVGFKQLNEPLGITGHYGCDIWYMKDL